MKKLTQEQLIKARSELEEMYRIYYEQEFGIKEGIIVVSDETYAKRRGCDCRVEEVIVNLNANPIYELKSKPRIKATVKTKNGWSKVPADLSGRDWKLKD